MLPNGAAFRSQHDATDTDSTRSSHDSTKVTELDNVKDSGKSSLAAIVSEDFDVLQAVGGWRGIVESGLPTLLFIVVYAFNAVLAPALLVALGSSALLIALRILQHLDPTPALGGLLGVAFSAFIAWRTGQASDFYIWGIIVALGYFAVLAISLLVKWPLMGVLIGFFRGDATGWRKDPKSLTARRYTFITILWTALFAVRAAVQIPLYFADATDVLGVAKLILGIPLFALVAWFSWLLVRDLPPTETDEDLAANHEEKVETTDPDTASPSR